MMLELSEGSEDTSLVDKLFSFLSSVLADFVSAFTS